MHSDMVIGKRKCELVMTYDVSESMATGVAKLSFLALRARAFFILLCDNAVSLC